MERVGFFILCDRDREFLAIQIGDRSVSNVDVENRSASLRSGNCQAFTESKTCFVTVQREIVQTADLCSGNSRNGAGKIAELQRKVAGTRDVVNLQAGVNISVADMVGFIFGDKSPFSHNDPQPYLLDSG